MASHGSRSRSSSGEKYLQSFLTKSEASHITRATQDKINKHFGSKLEEFSATQSLLESTKCRLEETANELQTQVEALNSELERSRGKLTSLENEVVSLKSMRDATIDENNKLTFHLKQKEAEINTLKTEADDLSTQLQKSHESRSECVTLNNELQNKQAVFQEQQKILEEEKAYLTKQVSSLSEEVNALRHDLQTSPLNHVNKVMKLESDLADVTNQLTAANLGLSKANEENKVLLVKINCLENSIVSQAHMTDVKIEKYKLELETTSRMAEFNKTQFEDAVTRVSELTSQIGELQIEYQKLNNMYNELETRYKDSESGIRDNEIITLLKNDLEQANELLSSVKNENLTLMAGTLTPSAAALSKILKCDMSITQIYSQLVKATDQLKVVQLENSNLNNTIRRTEAELTEKQTTIENVNAEKEAIIQKNMEMEQNLNDVTLQRNKLKEEVELLSNQLNDNKQQVLKLNNDLKDMGKQVCHLLQQAEKSQRTDVAETNDATTDDSKTMITFNNIEELQKNNQELLRKVRDLTEKLQFEERNNVNSAYLELSVKVKRLEISVGSLKETECSLKNMLGTSMRQRNMYKKLLDDYMKAKRMECNPEVAATEETMDTSNTDNSENELIKAQKQLECLKKEYEMYKNEKDINHKILQEENDKMRQEVYILTISNNRSASSAEFTEKRASLLECNLDLCRKLITSLEMRNNMYKDTNSKYEELFKKLRDESLTALKQLATAEVFIEKYKLECKLLKDTETRLQAEIEVLNRERQSQGVVAKNLEMIKICLQRSEVEKIGKLELKLQESTRDCETQKRKYQEQVEKLKALELQMNTQSETANARIQEEKLIANGMRVEITQLRQDLFNRNKSNEELAKKLKMALTSDNSTNLYELMKQTKRLEYQITEKNNVIQSLQQQLSEANEHLKEVSDKYKKGEEDYKDMIKKSECKLTSTEQSLEMSQSRIKALEDELLLRKSDSFSNVDDDQKDILIKLSKCQEELKSAQSELKDLTAKLNASKEKYALETLLHSHDVQALTKVKGELSELQNEFKKTVALKDDDIKKLQIELNRLKEAESGMSAEHQHLLARFEELSSQNNLLHEQIEAFSAQLSHSRSHNDSMNESGNKSQINTSVNEDEITSPEQLLKIIKCMRKEKNIIMSKCDIYQSETVRLKTQLASTENQLTESNETLNNLRISLIRNEPLTNEPTELLKKVELLDAITDSNKLLRNERDSLLARVDELVASSNAYNAEITPLQNNIAELTTKNKALELENADLKSETAGLKRDLVRLKNRVNALADRQNKTSPEDWKRLQNERETLAKMLTTEKENVTKLSEELKVLKRTYDETHAKLNQDLEKLDTEQSQKEQEILRLNNEIKEVKMRNDQIREALITKESVISNIGSSQTQMKKIAKKYKEQFVELADTAEKESKSQLTTQSNLLKQQSGETSPTSDPPTANIKPTAGASQQSPGGSRRGAEPLLASVRPLAQVGPSAPDMHSTEYMPASSSRRLSRTLPTTQTGPAQEMDRSAGDGMAQSSSHLPPQLQAVALVMPRMEQPGGSTSSAASTGPPSSGVSTSLAPQTRHLKRTRSGQQAHNKKMRLQDISRSEDVEYQVPTSSRSDQDDDNVIIVDSDEGSCTQTIYTTREVDNDDEIIVTEERGDSRPQSSAASSFSLLDNLGGRSHTEASSSDTDPLVFSDCISEDRLVPLKPVMYLTRRDADANVPQTSYTGRAARILYSEAGMSGHHTLLELDSPMPARRSSRNTSREEQGSTVSSQGSGLHLLHRVQEEGREAEASLGPPRRRSYRSQQQQESTIPLIQELHAEDSETSSSTPTETRGSRGRGGRKRGVRRASRHKH